MAGVCGGEGGHSGPSAAGGSTAQAGTCPWTRQLAAFLSSGPNVPRETGLSVVVKAEGQSKGKKSKEKKEERDKDPNSWDVSELQKGK